MTTWGSIITWKRAGIFLYTLFMLTVLLTVISHTYYPYVDALWNPDPKTLAIDAAAVGALSNYYYTLITLFMFLTVLGAAGLTINQISEATRARKLDFVLEAYKAYSTPAMGRAIRTMWRDSDNIKEFAKEWHALFTPDGKQPWSYSKSKDAQRRQVSDFWNTIGWAVKAELIEAKFIELRFQEAPMVWQRVYPLEVHIQLTSPSHANLSEQERRQKALQHVEKLPGHWLYTKWIREYKYEGPSLNYEFYLQRLRESDGIDEVKDSLKA